ncbi:hypothetical protein [Nonomuraea salmonea]|uniref:hypothetical protein n=1 Tax=Nonomuraea salmonea TaxID=46181 RepID=UPI0031EFB8A8
MARNVDDVLIPATHRLPADRLDALQPWPLGRAVPYAPAYVAGHHSLRYDVEPRAGMDRAKGVMAEAIEGDCRRDIGGRTYQVLINGVSGEVQGERPYSVVKIVSAVLAALALVAVVVWLYQAYRA